MLHYIYRKINRITCLALVLLLLFPVRSHAAASAVLPLEPQRPEVVSVELPVVREDEEAPFDFLLDPQGLLYATQAARYGGGTVEEGATLYFRNREGAYGFSGASDMLTVTNRSTVPALVTVTARIDHLGDLLVAPDGNFSDSDLPAVYLALTDDRGNVVPLSADEAVSLTLEMAAAPEFAYVYRLDEASQSYTYGLSADPSQIAFDTYAFGLTGSCNPNADWEDVAVSPVVTVTWKVEPVMPETMAETEDETTEPETETEETTESSGPKETELETETTESKAAETTARESTTSGETGQSAGRVPETGTGVNGGQQTTDAVQNGPGVGGSETVGGSHTGTDKETTGAAVPGTALDTTAGSTGGDGEPTTAEHTDDKKETETSSETGTGVETGNESSSAGETEATPEVTTVSTTEEQPGTETTFPAETTTVPESETMQTTAEPVTAGRTGTLVEQDQEEPEGQVQNEV